MKSNELRKIDPAENKKHDTLKLKNSVKDIEDKLKKMGIERPRYGPRISDPAHTNEKSYLY